jgi:hypothetical protein
MLFYSAREPAKPILNSHTVFLSSNCAINLYPGDHRNYKHVEALQFHSTTQSHWSSGSTVCFPSRGSAVCVPGMHKLAMELGFSC